MTQDILGQWRLNVGQGQRNDLLKPDDLPAKDEKGHYRLDPYLRYVLDIVYKDIRNDYDSFIIITGREGFGKSTLAAQVAKYLDRSYCLDRCCFTPDQFEAAVQKASKYQAIVFDETMGYLGSRGAMSKFNKSLVKIFSEMRSRNLIVIICIPNFFELDKYPAIHRSTGLLHVYRRGRMASFDYYKKKNLYLKGKKTYNMASQSPTFKANFTKFFPINMEEYEVKKLTSTRAMMEDKDTRIKRGFIKAIGYFHNTLGIGEKEIAEILAVPLLSVRYHIKMSGIGGEEEGK